MYFQINIQINQNHQTNQYILLQEEKQNTRKIQRNDANQYQHVYIAFDWYKSISDAQGPFVFVGPRGTVSISWRYLCRRHRTESTTLIGHTCPRLKATNDQLLPSSVSIQVDPGAALYELDSWCRWHRQFRRRSRTEEADWLDCLQGERPKATPPEHRCWTCLKTSACCRCPAGNPACYASACPTGHPRSERKS